MVHQLSLVATVPHNNYVQTISTLQALTGLTLPQHVSTYTLVTKPHDVFKPKFEPGKVNQIEQYYMKCITVWDDEPDFDMTKPLISKNGDNILATKLFNDAEQSQKTWTLQVADIPIAGKNQVCSAQTIYESTLVHHHTQVKSQVAQDAADANPEQDTIEIDIDDKPLSSFSEPNPQDANVDNDSSKVSYTRKDSFLQFIEDLGYDVVNQYWIKGVQFFHGDIIIEVFKILIRDDSKEADNGIPLKLLDESNTFQLKALINVPKSTDVEQINQGSKELLKLQDFLKNLVKLEIPDRIYMDSRVAK